MSDQVLVKVESVSKKFCRSLKRSLWYGVQDVSAEVFGRKGSHDELCKNEFWAVNDASFELKRGECLGLIGPNGASLSRYFDFSGRYQWARRCSVPVRRHCRPLRRIFEFYIGQSCDQSENRQRAR